MAAAQFRAGFCLLALLCLCSRALDAKKTYIVHMKHDAKPLSFATHDDWYAASLESVSSEPADSLLYTYKEAMSGFAAHLDDEQVEMLRQSEDVLDVYEETVYHLHTTRSANYLHLPLPVMKYGEPQGLYAGTSDVIIGVLDTGVDPLSPCFKDTGMPSVPPRWKGNCLQCLHGSLKSACNKKLIGLRSFYMGYLKAGGQGANEVLSCNDEDGHGTHTASTAAGALVNNASLFGYASGIARGMASLARLAAYKVCWKAGCFSSDILSAIDLAIRDGVDVLSLSLGGGSPALSRDIIAVGTFQAMKRGIFVACSAGNSGPALASLSNVAPWVTTVGAGTIDRHFPAYAVLGNGKTLAGVSLYSGPALGTKPLQLVYQGGSNESSKLCLEGSLDPEMVSGKIVVCDRGVNARVEKGMVVKSAGGLGMILANTAASGEELVADSHLVAAVALGLTSGYTVRSYAKRNRSPVATLQFGGTLLNVKPSPVVAAFSSRGPNTVTPNILKPDLIAPGVNILAGWAKSVGPSGLPSDKRTTRFNILSGTSMSCPHVSGLAAVLKAAHPDWSPSAIKSAMMTTAFTRDNTGQRLKDAATNRRANSYAFGSGFVNFTQALDPGLVYDASHKDYIKFVCSLGYSESDLSRLIHNETCPRMKAKSNPCSLNYPSFSVVFGPKKAVVRCTRTVTNVGPAVSSYEFHMRLPATVVASVNPSILHFKRVGQKQRYTITFVAKLGPTTKSSHGFGRLDLVSGKHKVSSPVSISWATM